MQNEFLHNIHHVEIHGLADIDIERHTGNNIDDGEDETKSFPEILLDASDENGIRFFHSIECTMKYDTIRAIFSKQNQDACNEILNDLDIWLSSKFIDVSLCHAFRAQQSVKAYTSTIEERKTQHHVKFNAYAQRISKRVCTSNPSEPDESFGTAPLMIPKRCINVSYAAAVAAPSPQHTQPINTYTAPATNADVMDMSLNIPKYTGDNSGRLAELESSLLSIKSK
jgi:hypothetical protein